MRHARQQAYLAAAAALFLTAGLALFVLVIEPVNQQHAYGIPENWRTLRTQWEYGHAANAGLHLLAMVAITLCVVRPAAADRDASGTLVDGSSTLATRSAANAHLHR
jgi:hypothetical protein